MAENRWQKGDSRQKAQLIIQRFEELKNRRAPFLKQWIAISKYISPFSGRFNVNDHGENRTTAFILDSEATYDHKILTSGLMSGASSPARAWFKLQPKSEELMDNYDVIDWCAKAENIMQKIFQQSNTYNTLHQIYKELVLFGTAVDLIYDDLNNVIQHHLLTAGEYCLDTNDKGDVDTLYREFQLTTIQAVKAFGYKTVPHEIKDANLLEGGEATHITQVSGLDDSSTCSHRRTGDIIPILLLVQIGISRRGINLTLYKVAFV